MHAAEQSEIWKISCPREPFSDAGGWIALDPDPCLQS